LNLIYNKLLEWKKHRLFKKCLILILNKINNLYKNKLLKSIIETDIILEQINKENYEWYLKIIKKC
jgi:hypothetical protein